MITRRDALKTTALTALGLPLIGASSAFAAEPVKGLKLGVASYSLSKLSVDEVIAALKEMQISYVGLYKTHAPWSDGTPEKCREVGEKFKAAGITISGTGVVDLPNNEEAVRKAFENGKAAGLKTMVCKPALDSFPLVEKFVQEYDIKVAIHNHGPEDKVYPSPYDAWKAIQKYDKRIGLCIDVGHAARGGANPAEAILKCRARLYDIHLKDSLAEAGAVKDVPVEVGKGKLDIKGILTALLEIKYPHVVAFEYEKKTGDALTGLKESVEYVRGLLKSMS